jgi:hypothetical protein
MLPRLPDNIRSAVIQQWLAGHPRDKIAFDCGISAGLHQFNGVFNLQERAYL